MIEIRHQEAATSIAARPAMNVRPVELAYPNAKPAANQTQVADA
ncbi:hypothetical protein [Paenarthrobacter sp.]|nr:hypothetical protein [Paenarthrobacter sp.]